MRQYERTHPWIAFEAKDVGRLLPRHWMLVGESRSKCEHLAGTPLKPEVAKQMYKVTLVKGALATTAIEGNTLNEDQVRGILDGSYKAPPSRQYQEQEVRNVLDALQGLHDRIRVGEDIRLTTAMISDFNFQILKGTDLREDVVPGELRTGPVVVGNYRAAPAEDCRYLLDKLVEWLNGPMFEHDDPEIQFALTLAKAIYAHLYLAWIHPFGDGNGRTARLVEFTILASCGHVPVPAAHLLSDHYNYTRDRYYRELDRASKPGENTLGFLSYAIEGFIDGIRETIMMVRIQQIQVAWVNYVHDQFAALPNTKASHRQRSMVLAMPMDGTAVNRDDVEGLTPKIAKLYATAGPRVLSRDLNRLIKLGLITQSGRRYTARVQVVQAFLPVIA